ncbi:MFS transporter [Nonomuraea sp. NPDC059194]|uniref:MFS transporter n=1 Tax=Nonomuraea sp. NPDC059194 TaxID=3346764 RepID=UPI0036916B11
MKQTLQNSLPLRRQRDYRLLWTARTISITGSEVSRLAVPLTAVTLLSASPAQMGVLTAMASVPVLLFGLHAGALADRLRRHRPLMIACELVAACAAFTVPLAWFTGMLTVPLLIAVALVIGTAGVVFKAANFTHLAVVVPAAQRTEAMAGFQASYSVASIAGPGLAGLLVQVLTAPLAVLTEGVSFLASALMLRSIRTPEHHEPGESRGMWRDVVEGLRISVTNPVLRAILGAGITLNFFAMAYIAIAILYMLHVLRIPQGMIGALTAITGVGGIIGAWATTRLARRFGESRLMAYTILLFPVDILTVGLVGGPLWVKISIMAASSLLIGMLVTCFATCMNVVSMREAPVEVTGRVNATMTFAIQGVLALGGLTGGLLAEVVGLRAVILICACGTVLAGIWIWRSPLRPRRRPRPSLDPDPVLTAALKEFSLVKIRTGA